MSNVEPMNKREIISLDETNNLSFGMAFKFSDQDLAQSQSCAKASCLKIILEIPIKYFGIGASNKRYLSCKPID